MKRNIGGISRLTTVQDGAVCHRYSISIPSVNNLQNPRRPFHQERTLSLGQRSRHLLRLLQWSSVNGADYYALAISKYPYGTENIVYNPQNIYEHSIEVPANILVNEEKYRWNLQAHNSAGVEQCIVNTVFQRYQSTSG